MLEIPNANIHTLRDLMDDAEPFMPHMEKLEGSARYFFEREFFDRSFGPTKKQIAKRLWGVLATPSFERMFAQSENKIDIFDLLNRGSVIIINTSKDLLKQEGCKLFGRFFLSMIAQATMERSVISERDRTPTTVYVDEAQEYFDDSVDILLSQARKMRVGVVAAHQTLDQLTPELKASFMSNIGTKVVGGLSSKDAHAFASEMHVESDFLQSLKKRRSTSEFALYVRHQTPQALRIDVPLGLIENEKPLTVQEYDTLLKQNRLRFSGSNTPIERVDRPFRIRRADPSKKPHPDRSQRASKAIGEKGVEDVAESKCDGPSSTQALVKSEDTLKTRHIAQMAVKPGRGGREHKYIQELVKGLAEQKGFLARIENEVLDGDGFVDVALIRGDERIACEIAITTPVEREVANIVKCLNAGFSTVWIIAPETRHLSAIRRLAEESLTAQQIASLSFFKPGDLPTLLASDAVLPKANLVRGYKVRVKRTTASQLNDEVRRDVVGETLARSAGQQRQMPLKS